MSLTEYTFLGKSQVFYKKEDIDKNVIPPEDCILVAHDTGEGWILSVETQEHDTVAILKYPWLKGKTAKELNKYGFEVI